MRCFSTAIELPLAIGRMVLAVGLLSGCQSVTQSTDRARSLDRAQCADEAVQIAAPDRIEVIDPVSGKRLAELAAGRFVYLCGTQGDWTGVMFPAEGERIDCSQRGLDRLCAVGWVRGRLETVGFD